MAEEGLSLPMTEEGFFSWAGPLAQCRHQHGPISLLPPHSNYLTYKYLFNYNTFLGPNYLLKTIYLFSKNS